MKIFKKHWPILATSIFFFLIYCFIQIIKHEFQFQTFGLDLGFYDQILWKASHLVFTKSTIAEVVGQQIRLSFFENDFHLTLLPVAFVYRFIPSVWVLFLAQAFFAVGLTVVLYFSTLVKVPSKLLALGVAVSVLLSVPFQHAIFDGFTPEVFGAFFLALFFYALFSGRRRLLWLSVFAMLISKVEFSPVVAILGIIVLLFEKKKIIGLKIFLIGTASFVFLVYILNPLISPAYRNYGHYSLGYGSIGNNPQEVLANLVTRPATLLSAVFSPPVKLSYLFAQLASYAFLPLAGFQVWLLLFFEFFTRLANGVMIAKWPLHSFTISAVSGVALIYTAVNLRKKIRPHFLGVILLATALAGDFFFHGPINSLFKPQFYQQSTWSRANHKILDKIPAGGSVAANNSLVPHLSQREEIFLLPDVHGAKYVVADLHDWPNAFTPSDQKEITALIENLTGSGQYQITAKIDDTVLLERR